MSLYSSALVERIDDIAVPDTFTTRRVLDRLFPGQLIHPSLGEGLYYTNGSQLFWTSSTQADGVLRGSFGDISAPIVGLYYDPKRNDYAHASQRYIFGITAGGDRYKIFLRTARTEYQDNIQQFLDGTDMELIAVDMSEDGVLYVLGFVHNKLFLVNVNEEGGSVRHNFGFFTRNSAINMDKVLAVGVKGFGFRSDQRLQVLDIAGLSETEGELVEYTLQQSAASEFQEVLRPSDGMDLTPVGFAIGVDYLYMLVQPRSAVGVFQLYKVDLDDYEDISVVSGSNDYLSLTGFSSAAELGDLMSFTAKGEDVYGDRYYRGLGENPNLDNYTGPGSSNTSSYVVWNSANRGDGAVLSGVDGALVLPVSATPVEWQNGGDRTMRLRVCMQYLGGNYSDSLPTRLYIDMRNLGESAWVNKGQILPWYFADASVGTLLDSFYDTYNPICSEVGGWVDFSYTVSSSVAEVRLRPEFSAEHGDGDCDIALRGIYWDTHDDTGLIQRQSISGSGAVFLEEDYRNFILPEGNISSVPVVHIGDRDRTSVDMTADQQLALGNTFSELLSFISYDFVDDLFPDNDVQNGIGNGGPAYLTWRYKSSGSTPTSTTGPGSNNTRNFMWLEISSRSSNPSRAPQDGQENPRLLLPLPEFSDSYGEASNRTVSVRLNYMMPEAVGQNGYNASFYTALEAQYLGGGDWEELGRIFPWIYSNAYTVGDIMPAVRDDYEVECDAAGGWGTFTYDVPDNAIALRLRVYLTESHGWRGDFCIRGLIYQYMDDEAPAISNQRSDNNLAYTRLPGIDHRSLQEVVSSNSAIAIYLNSLLGPELSGDNPLGDGNTDEIIRLVYGDDDTELFSFSGRKDGDNYVVNVLNTSGASVGEWSFSGDAEPVLVLGLDGAASSEETVQADAGEDQSIVQGQEFTLSGRDASGNTDGLLSYLWTQVGGPIVLSVGRTSASVTLIANLSSEDFGSSESLNLQFRLTVTREVGGVRISDTDLVTITVRRQLRERPRVNLGPDFTTTILYRPGLTVQLDPRRRGGHVVDADDVSLLTFLWGEVGTTFGGLTDSDELSASYVIPDAAANQIVRLRLTVTDTEGDVGSDDVLIHVGGPITSIVEAHITLPDGRRFAETYGDVQLSAQNSSGEGNLSFLWTQVSGVDVDIEDDTEIVATFATPEVPMAGSNLVFRLRVRDQVYVTDNTREDTVEVTIIIENVNKPPVAQAGSDRVVNEGSVVTLDASGSTDPDDVGGQATTISSYSWMLFSRMPSTAPVGILEDANSSVATFITVNVSVDVVYTFRVTVADTDGLTNDADVNVTVNRLPNSVPVVVPEITSSDSDDVFVGNRFVVSEGATITLDGSDSTDEGGEIVGYSWAQVSGPLALSIINANAATATFTAPVNPTLNDYVWEIRLTITDDEGSVSSETVIVMVVANSRPIARISGDLEITETETTTLSGVTSTDSDGTIASYAWRISSGGGSLSGLSGEEVVFTPENISGQTTYSIALVVTDDDGVASAPEIVDVVVSADSTLPIADAGDDQTARSNSLVTLDGSDSVDPTRVDGVLVYAWEVESTNPQVVGLSDVTVEMPTFTAPIVLTGQEIYVFRLRVTDVDGQQSTVDSVRVTIVPNRSPQAVIGNDNPTTVTEGDRLLLDHSASNDPDGELVDIEWSVVSEEVDVDILENSLGEGLALARVGTSTEFGISENFPRGIMGYDGVLYGVFNGADALVILNTVTGVATEVDSTLVRYGLTTLNVDMRGIAVDSAGNVYCADNFVRVIYELSLTTGVVSNGVNFSNGSLGLRDMAFVGDDLYMIIQTTISGVSMGALWRVDLTDPDNSEKIGPDHFGLDSSSDMVSLMSYDGKLFTYRGSNRGVYELSITTGEAFFLTSLSVVSGSSSVGTGVPGWDVLDGVLYLMSNTRDYLYSVEVTGPSYFIDVPDVDRLRIVELQLRVVDDEGGEDREALTVRVNRENNPPVADAGENQQFEIDVGASQVVTLDGSGTSDPDAGEVLTYLWAVLTGNPSTVVLSDTSAVSPMFTLVGAAVGIEGRYSFQLTVTDSFGVVSTDSTHVDVVVPNVRPVADAGMNIRITTGVTATLDGSGSSDSDGSIVSYRWEYVPDIDDPLDDLFIPRISNPMSVTTLVTFRAAAVENQYRFRLTVVDNEGARHSNGTTVFIEANSGPLNLPPVADAGGDRFHSLVTSSVIVLDASSSTDESLITATFSWVVAANLDFTPSLPRTTFNTSLASLTVGALPDSLDFTDLEITLTITDSSSESDTDEITIRVFREGTPKELDLDNVVFEALFIKSVSDAVVYETPSAFTGTLVDGDHTIEAISVSGSSIRLRYTANLPEDYLTDNAGKSFYFWVEPLNGAEDYEEIALSTIVDIVTGNNTLFLSPTSNFRSALLDGTRVGLALADSGGVLVDEVISSSGLASSARQEVLESLVLRAFDARTGEYIPMLVEGGVALRDLLETIREQLNEPSEEDWSFILADRIVARLFIERVVDSPIYWYGGAPEWVYYSSAIVPVAKNTLSVVRGRDSHRGLNPPRVPTASGRFHDPLGVWYSSRPFSPGDPLSVVAVTDKAVTRGVFTGFIDDVKYRLDEGVYWMDVTANGVTSRLTFTRVYGPVQSSDPDAQVYWRVRDGVEHVLDRAEWDIDNDLHIVGDDFAIVMSHWWLRGEPVWVVLNRLVATEGPPASYYEDEAGRLRFHKLRLDIVQRQPGLIVGLDGSLTEGRDIPLQLIGKVNEISEFEDVSNYAEVSVRRYRESEDNTQIWSRAQRFEIGVGRTYDLTAEFGSPIVDLDNLALPDFESNAPGGTVDVEYVEKNATRLVVRFTANTTGNASVRNVSIQGRILDVLSDTLVSSDSVLGDVVQVVESQDLYGRRPWSGRPYSTYETEDDGLGVAVDAVNTYIEGVYSRQFRVFAGTSLEHSLVALELHDIIPVSLRFRELELSADAIMRSFEHVWVEGVHWIDMVVESPEPLDVPGAQGIFLLGDINADDTPSAGDGGTPVGQGYILGGSE